MAGGNRVIGSHGEGNSDRIIPSTTLETRLYSPRPKLGEGLGDALSEVEGGEGECFFTPI